MSPAPLTVSTVMPRPCCRPKPICQEQEETLKIKGKNKKTKKQEPRLKEVGGGSHFVFFSCKQLSQHTYIQTLVWNDKQIFKPKDTYTIDRDPYLYKPSPREATSVAMRMGAFPERNSVKQAECQESQVIQPRLSGYLYKMTIQTFLTIWPFYFTRLNFK